MEPLAPSSPPRLAAWLTLLALAAWPASAAETSFSFSKLNRSYENLVGELQPISEGPLTVELSSPGHTLVLKGNQLVLTPLAGASEHGARLELDLMGKGQLVADLEGAGLRTRLQDEVFVPRQTVKLAGKVRLRRVEGGYEVTPLELPPRIEVAIQSKLSNDILSLCDGVAIFTGIECGALERALTRPAIPLPAVGGSYLLPDADLTDGDRAALDALLGPAAAGH